MGGLSGLFKAEIITSCAGGALTLVLIALRPVTSRIFGHVWQYYIYLAALVIMLIPVSFGRTYSPYPEPIDAPEHAETEAVSSRESEKVADTTANTSQAAVPASVKRGARIYAARLGGVMKYIWLTGAAIFLLGAIISYARFSRLLYKNSRNAECGIFDETKARMGIKRHIRLIRSRIIDAPLMTGIIRPTLVLPEYEMSESELRCVIVHELTHYKRRDLLYKQLALIVNALHWFNPLAYLLVQRISEDCEISCDVTITRRMSVGEKKEYMRTIVNLMTQ